MSEMVKAYRDIVGASGLPASQAQAVLNMAIACHNAAIEEAAKVAEAAHSDDHGYLIAEAIRKLKRAP